MEIDIMRYSVFKMIIAVLSALLTLHLSTWYGSALRSSIRHVGFSYTQNVNFHAGTHLQLRPSDRTERVRGTDFIPEGKEDDDADDDDLQQRFSRNRPTQKPSQGIRSMDRPVLFSGKQKWQVINRAIVAGIFVAGIGTGITIDSAINTNPKDLASRDAIDKNAPNPRLCATYGSSAMVLDQRVFVTFNPFSIYVTQADTKPGCVLRPANVVSQLQKERKLLSDEEVDSCKNGFNTWAFVGDINNNPQLNCVFQSDDAQNEFLSNPKIGLGEDVYDDSKSSSPVVKP